MKLAFLFIMVRCFLQAFPVSKFRSLSSRLFHLQTSVASSGQIPRKVLVATTDGLQKAVTHLSKCTEIAIDLEFDRNSYAYGFTLCLIQINGNNETFIIDPLAPKMDLSPLYRDVLESDKILKVIHSPSEDLRLLQTLQCFPVQLFDTERCAKLLNFNQTSLSFLLSTFLGVNIDKSEQTSNWIRRPLSDAQLTYAANDVAHLLELKNRMMKLVEERGIPPQWIQDENDDWAAFRYEPRASTKLSSAREERMLSPFQLHIFNALLGVREKYAEKLQKPPHWVISKDPLLDGAINHQSVRDLKLDKVRGAHRIFQDEKVLREFHRVFRLAKKQATELQLSRLVAREEVTDSVQFEKYVALKERVAERYGDHAANFILTRPLLRKLAANHSHAEEIPQPYRRDLVRALQRELNITSTENSDDQQ